MDKLERETSLKKLELDELRKRFNKLKKALQSSESQDMFEKLPTYLLEFDKKIPVEWQEEDGWNAITMIAESLGIIKPDSINYNTQSPEIQDEAITKIADEFDINKKDIINRLFRDPPDKVGLQQLIQNNVVEAYKNTKKRAIIYVLRAEKAFFQDYKKTNGN